MRLFGKVLGPFALLMVLVLLTGGCQWNRRQPAPRQPRPVAGDTVTPLILLGLPWQQQGLVLMSARLQVQGPEPSAPALLQLEDVPYEMVPTVTLTFFEQDRELEQIKDVALVRDC
jgi:hypothetical protein